MCALEDKPFTHEMRPCNSISPDSQLVDRWVRNIVGRIQADDTLNQGPGAESTTGKRSDGGSRPGWSCWQSRLAATVYTLRKMKSAVCLGGIENGDQGDLGKH